MVCLPLTPGHFLANSPVHTKPLVQSLLGSLALCGLLLSVGCQPKSDTSTDSTLVDSSLANIAPTQKVVADERLWLTPPEGWTLVSSLAETTRHVRYLDPKETNQSLTIESRDNTTLGSPAADPLDVLKLLAENEQSNCSKAKDFNTFTGFEEGFGTVVRLFICEPNELVGGRVRLLKIIQGQQKTYLVALEYLWSNSITAPKVTGNSSNNLLDRVAAWSLYLRNVRLCAASGCQQQVEGMAKN